VLAGPQQLPTIATASSSASTTLHEQVGAFDADLRKFIAAKFGQLPADLTAPDALKQAKADILKEVDIKTQAARQ
jgi:hypothetical protein